jgi:hypothetical protein
LKSFLLFDILFFVLYSTIMSDAASAATLTHLFKGLDAQLGVKLTDSVDVGWMDTLLYHMVSVLTQGMTLV